MPGPDLDRGSNFLRGGILSLGPRGAGVELSSGPRHLVPAHPLYQDRGFRKGTGTTRTPTATLVQVGVGLRPPLRETVSGSYQYAGTRA